MRSVLGSLLGALLPEPQRSAVERRLGGDAALASFLLGVGEFLVGTRLLVGNALTQLYAMADELATAYLAEAERRTVGPQETIGFTWGGAVLWLFWLSRPSTWVLISIPLVGLLRVVSFLTTRQPIAEPSIWALVRLVAFGQRYAAATRERADFGPAEEPDEVEAEGDQELLVYTARQRPEWSDASTIEVVGRFYRLAQLDTVARAGRRRYRYRLAETGEHDLIRRYLRYDPPDSGIRRTKPQSPTAAPDARA